MSPVGDGELSLTMFYRLRMLVHELAQAFLHVPLDCRYSWARLNLWLVLALLLAALSSQLPAWNASRLTVREVLAYA